MSLTFGSLFAGIGGFDLGFERAGMRCEWQVEIDPYCQRVLAKHWPNVRRWDDVRNVSSLPPVDIICGGFPCKNTSLASAIHGGRSGLAGAESGLWHDMLRIVRHNRPRTVVVENVGGAMSWSAQIKTGLEDAGYFVPDLPICVPAEAVGAPHSRIRLFWVADVDRKRLAFARQTGPSPLERLKGGATNGNLWVSSLARALRMDDGLPTAVDRRKRIEALGNAVVPQVAEWIGRRIVEAA
jgi:DNA (cytosine-5)-methyltransferase 1